jgi:hypothetical protein
VLVDRYVKSGMTVGVDSGPFCTAIIQQIGNRLKEHSLAGIKLIPTCNAASQEATFESVPQATSADQKKVQHHASNTATLRSIRLQPLCAVSAKSGMLWQK